MRTYLVLPSKDDPAGLYSDKVMTAIKPVITEKGAENWDEANLARDRNTTVPRPPYGQPK